MLACNYSANTKQIVWCISTIIDECYVSSGESGADFQSDPELSEWCMNWFNYLLFEQFIHLTIWKGIGHMVNGYKKEKLCTA